MKNHLINLIQNSGPIRVSQFMREVLVHPQLGYYNRQNPFGKDGDFVTAPEISQVFGELLGAYFASMVMNYYFGKKVNLVEMGAGKGTLMADFLRVSKNIPDFFDNLEIHIIEISPRLREIQQEKLKDYKITWWQCFDSFYEANSKNPLFFLSNELFDCFAIDQLVKTENGWREKLVGIKDGKLEFILSDATQKIDLKAEIGAVLEVSNEAEIFMEKLSKAVKQSGGMALIIDYGYEKNEFRNTLQALKNHQFADVLETAGDSDLTALVNFEILQKIAQKFGLKTSLANQKHFLELIGIEARRKKLLEGKALEQQEKINSAIDRLIDQKQMGELFKCLAICA